MLIDAHGVQGNYKTQTISKLVQIKSSNVTLELHLLAEFSS